MKVHIKVSESGGGFGGLAGAGKTSEADITASDYEMEQATGTAIMLLSSLGVATLLGADGDDAAVGTTSETTEAEREPDEDTPEDGYVDGDTRDDVPAAGWADAPPHGSQPGDAVVLVWPGGESRAFIDNGAAWVAPYVAGKFDEPMTVEYTDSTVTVVVVSRQPEPGAPYPGFSDNQE